MAASARLRAGLLRGERIGKAMIRNIEAGVPVSSSVDASGTDAATMRRSTNDLLEDFEHSRHRMRVAFMLPSLAEGMSIGAIGRTLGISRQLASRFVREAKEELGRSGPSEPGD